MGLISGIFFIRDVPGSTNFKTKIWRILIIYILLGRFSLYITGSRTFTILKDSSFIKSNLLLSLMFRIKIIFVFGVLLGDIL